MKQYNEILKDYLKKEYNVTLQQATKEQIEDAVSRLHDYTDEEVEDD